MQDAPKIYLITPQTCELSFYGGALAKILDAKEIACLRLGLQSGDENTIKRHLDNLRDEAHKRDVPVLIDTHYTLVDQMGIDGVHVTRPVGELRKIRDEIGKDAVLGCHCRNSRHDGMTAGEIGADYVAFGPVSADALNPEMAEFSVFEWWSEMVEIPVVAEGNITEEDVSNLRHVVDFFALGEEIWSQGDDANAAIECIFNRLEAP